MPNPTPEYAPDYVALTMVLVLLIFVAVLTVRKYLRRKRAARTAAPLPAPGIAGQIKLYDTDPRTAAMIMAIVAYKLDKPLNELRFRSIREIRQQ